MSGGNLSGIYHFYTTATVVYKYRYSTPDILGMVNGYVATDNILCNKLNIQP